MKQYLFLLLLISSVGFSQNVQKQIDSLSTLINNTKSEKRGDYIFDLGVLYASNSKDSIQFSEAIITNKIDDFSDNSEIFNFKMGLVSGYYDINDIEKSKLFLERSLKNITNSESKASYHRSKALILQRQNNYEQAKANYKIAISIYKEINDESSLKECYNNIASCSQQLGQYEAAINYQQSALKLADKLKDITSKSKSLNNLSVLYQKLDDLETSEKYIIQAIKLDESLNDEKGLAGSYVNLGIVNRKMALKNDDKERFKKAKESYLKALAISEKENLVRIKAASLANLANLENDFENYDSAIEFGKKSIAFSLKQNNVFGEMISRLNLGNSYRMNKEFKKSKTQLTRALSIAKQIKFQRGVEACYTTLSELYEDTKEFEKSLKYFKSLTKLKDSIASVDIKNNINELEIKYETEKKEREILEQRAVIAEKEVVLQRRSYQTYGALGLALILGLIGYTFYNQQKLKNIQLLKENQLKDALVKIETQNKLQEQRLQISRDLHDNIGAQLTFIISSIDNLKYGFELPKKLETKLTAISSFTNDTIYELRDTIWAMNKDKITFEDLQVRISNFINKANLSSQNIQFKFQVDAELNNNKTFTSIEGMNIYRIIQESINNALKYASATTININAREESNRLKVSVIDNGIGFDIQNIERGNGLNNIKKRADEINAQLEIKSSEGKGTNIQLVV